MIVDVVKLQRFRVHFQRVNVEEVFPVQRHAAEHRVIQGTFHDVGVLAVTFHFQHAASKHHQADRSAAFSIDRIVRQVVVTAEGLTAAL